MESTKAVRTPAYVAPAVACEAGAGPANAAPGAASQLAEMNRPSVQAADGVERVSGDGTSDLVAKAERAEQEEATVARRARTPRQVLRDEIEHRAPSTRTTKNYLVEDTAPTPLLLEQLSHRAGGDEAAFSLLRELVGGADFAMDSPHYLFVARCIDAAPFDAARWREQAGPWCDWYAAVLTAAQVGPEAVAALARRTAELLGLPGEVSASLVSPPAPGRASGDWSSKGMAVVHELLRSRAGKPTDPAAFEAALAELPPAAATGPTSRGSRTVAPSPERAARNLERLLSCITERSASLSPQLTKALRVLAEERARLAGFHDPEDTLVARLPALTDIPMGQPLPRSAAERDAAAAHAVRMYDYLFEEVRGALPDSAAAARAVAKLEQAHEAFKLWAHLGRTMLERCAPGTGRSLADELTALSVDGVPPYPGWQLCDALVEDLSRRRARGEPIDAHADALVQWLSHYAHVVEQQRASLAWLDPARAARVPEVPADFAQHLERRVGRSLAREALASVVSRDLEGAPRGANLDALRKWAHANPYRAGFTARMLAAEARDFFADLELLAKHDAQGAKRLTQHEGFFAWVRSVAVPALELASSVR